MLAIGTFICGRCSLLGSGSCHRDMGDSIFEEHLARASEPEALVPRFKWLLRVQDNHLSGAPGDRALHELCGETATASRRRSGDTSDARAVHFCQNPQRGKNLTLILGPMKTSGRLNISAIELVICCTLLDDKHVDSELQNRIQKDGVHLGSFGLMEARRHVRPSF